MNTLSTSFSCRAAKLGWVCPVISLIIFSLFMFCGQIVPRKMTPFVVQFALLLIAIGMISSIVALLGISKNGTKGILFPSIIGIIICALLVLFCVMVA